MMTKETVKTYVLENIDLLSLVKEINSFNSILEEYDFYENGGYFFKYYFENDVMSIIRAIHYGNYNYNDEYVNFDANGNLISMNKNKLDNFLKENIDDILDVIFEAFDGEKINCILKSLSK